ncbi:hypothetical protein [Winogradskyella sp. SM1960]|uniref:hypothetical protein n=1 Tax=Winogradskyella sp. SM1960 TaxID=2865955 RepID=UPI001CD65895|nr:hypothetical protein [Winogradskyella sp. SM1960]
MKYLLLLIPLFIGCSVTKEKSEYQSLLDYEGKYEYVDNTTLELKVSAMDTTLYAVIDNAKYPLKFIALDSFIDMQGSSVIFERDNSNKVINYKTDGHEFKLLTRAIDKSNMFPRKELFDNPENYVYKQPIETDDGLLTGNLDDEFKNPKLIVDMVKETIKGNFPDVHSILIYKNNTLVLE